MKIYDISINSKKTSAVFNPSIIRVGNNYLMACHGFRRYDEDIVKEPVDSVHHANHPWYGGPESISWWTPTFEGFNGTYIFLLDSNLKVVKELMELDDLIDMRLFKNPDGQIIATANKFVKEYVFGTDLDDEDDGINCLHEGCTAIVKGIVQLSSNYTVSNTEFKILCPFLSTKTEKNWSYWFYRGQNYISYMLTPKHVVFVETEEKKSLEPSRLPPLPKSAFEYFSDMNIARVYGEMQKPVRSDAMKELGRMWRELSDEEREPFIQEEIKGKRVQASPKTMFNVCKVLIERESSFLQYMSDFYEGELKFSLSTPAIPLGLRRWFGVGHGKLEYGVGKVEELQNTPGSKFLRDNEDLKQHPNALYFMFLYTFDPESLEILEISNCFFPPGATIGIVFPAGLTTTSIGNFLISYGEGDLKCKCMELTIAEVNGLLQKQTEFTGETYEFVRM